ncbi:MAG: TerC family protein [Bauldia sp.]
MFAWLSDPDIWASFLALAAMEVVLGIDNVVFISIITNGLPAAQAGIARKLGLGLALGFRILLLVGISWLIGLTAPALTVFGRAFSWRDLVLLAGGLFLVWKATVEIHASIEGEEEKSAGASANPRSLQATILQITLIDIVFSLDSIITAIGMASEIAVMIAAVVVAVAVMYAAAGAISDFIRRHPTTKMLALAFLFMIGAALIADGLGFHMPRGYIYAAMAFSAVVELLNIAARGRHSRPGS